MPSRRLCQTSYGLEILFGIGMRRHYNVPQLTQLNAQDRRAEAAGDEQPKNSCRGDRDRVSHVLKKSGRDDERHAQRGKVAANSYRGEILHPLESRQFESLLHIRILPAPGAAKCRLFRAKLSYARQFPGERAPQHTLRLTKVYWRPISPETVSHASPGRSCTIMPIAPRRNILFVGALVSMLGASVATPASPCAGVNADAEKAAILKVITAMQDAWNRG